VLRAASIAILHDAASIGTPLNFSRAYRCSTGLLGRLIARAA